MRSVRARLPLAVILLGVTSFFTDIGSEMIFPLLPIFLTESLRAGPGVLGLVEGAADALSSLLKLVSGYLSDRSPTRKPLVIFGYSLAGVARPLMALATSPWHVLAVRLTDRVGKGLRTSPRDALIADSAPPGAAGRAFGFHRAMDHAGAVVGPLVATALLAGGVTIRDVFWLAAIPGALALLTLFFVREPPKSVERPAAGSDASTPAPALSPRLRSYLAILLVFSLGNSSDAFLLLRARELEVTTALIPILWTVLHVSKLVSSYVGGILADRLGRTQLIVAGWMVFAGVYLALGHASAQWHAWALFSLYGLYHGLAEPAEKALVRDLAPGRALGRAFGYFNFIVGVSALPAGLLTGWLWREYGAPTALTLGATLAAVSSLLLVAWSRYRGPDE